MNTTQPDRAKLDNSQKHLAQCRVGSLDDPELVYPILAIRDMDTAEFIHLETPDPCSADVLLSKWISPFCFV